MDLLCQGFLLLSPPLAVVAGGLWETRSVFQGVWEGAGWEGWRRQPSIPRQTAGRGDGGAGEEGEFSTGRKESLCFRECVRLKELQGPPPASTER